MLLVAFIILVEALTELLTIEELAQLIEQCIIVFKVKFLYVNNNATLANLPILLDAIKSIFKFALFKLCIATIALFCLWYRNLAVLAKCLINALSAEYALIWAQGLSFRNVFPFYSNRNRLLTFASE